VQQIKIVGHRAFLGFGMELHQGKDPQNMGIQGFQSAKCTFLLKCCLKYCHP